MCNSGCGSLRRMTALLPAIVLFGDVVESRGDAGASAYLRGLRDELDAAYALERLAPAGFTQGDEIQLLLAPSADPIRAVMRGALRADARQLRWAVVAGPVEPGTGPATERNGPAFRDAREALERARSRREGLVATTGDAMADGLLADLGPPRGRPAGARGRPPPRRCRRAARRQPRDDLGDRGPRTSPPRRPAGF